MNSTRTHLIICCAGDTSLHSMWDVPERTYDICVIYYGKNADIAAKYKDRADLYFEGPGFKFGLIRDHIIPHYTANPAYYEKYTSIWVPDDDMEMKPEDVERMFSFSDEIGADIYQPSIANRMRPDIYPPYRQWISWNHTATAPAYKYRRINHPEIMMPGFSAHAFKHILLQSLIDYPSVVIGWALDGYWEIMWKKLHPGQKNQIFIYDTIYAFHTRPVSVGSIIHKLGETEVKFYDFIPNETISLDFFE